ncbi:UNVERIFIED_ORG: hypothetical protein ABIB19_003202 [Arthrobacter sp. UYEF10]
MHKLSTTMSVTRSFQTSLPFQWLLFLDIPVCPQIVLEGSNYPDMTQVYPPSGEQRGWASAASPNAPSTKP